MSIHLPPVVDRLCSRFPQQMVDAVTDFTFGERLVAIKNVTVNEDFFPGHFPGAPLMPGVLMIESMAQAASVLLLQAADGTILPHRASLRGADGVKFRKPVGPGDRVRLELSIERRRPTMARVRGVAYVHDQIVAEGTLVMAIEPEPAIIHPTAVVEQGAEIGAGTVVAPNAVIGPQVKIGPRCKIGAGAIIDGATTIGEGTEVFPYASIGLIPQDTKFRGEPTRLEIGKFNVFREFVTVHRGTEGGGGVTRIGDHNLFMAYSHIAHDCRVGHHTIFGNARHARRPRHRRGLRDDQRVFGRAPVLPHRQPRVHRRLLGGHQGRAAVCQDGGQSRPQLRPEHHRPDAARVHRPAR